MTERDAFEEWAKTTVWLNIERQKAHPHLYEKRETQLAWMAWHDRASKGELATKPKVTLTRQRYKVVQSQLGKSPLQTAIRRGDVDILESLEWSMVDEDHLKKTRTLRFKCYECGRLEQEGHHEDCRVKLLLKLTGRR